MVDIFLEEWDGEGKRKGQVDFLVLEGSGNKVGLCEFLQSKSTSGFRMLHEEGTHGETDETYDEQLKIHD